MENRPNFNISPSKTAGYQRPLASKAALGFFIKFPSGLSNSPIEIGYDETEILDPSDLTPKTVDCHHEFLREISV
jgi:hypothetical protein